MKDDAVLVLVVRKESAERLIQAGHELADKQNRSLRVLSIQPRAAMNGNCAETLEYLFQTANNMKADLTVFYQDDAAETAIEYIKEQRISCVVAGQPLKNKESCFLQKLRKGTKGIAMHLTEEAYRSQTTQRPETKLVPSLAF